MPKPKNKPNAFSVFCQEWRKKQEQIGRHFSMADAMSHPDCNKAWKELPEDQKTRYKTLAKKTTIPVEVDKKTGLGESLSEIEKAERKKKEFMDKMKDYINSITKAAKENDRIQKLVFYVIHTNYLYNRTLDNNEVEYYPAEICIARCSLESGIEEVHHVLVKEKILKGYRNDAATHSKETHQIPIDLSEGKSDYKEIFRDLCKFLEPDRENKMLPPLYTVMATENVYYPVKSILGKLSAAGDEYNEYLRLYAFEDLFASMYNTVTEQTGDMDFESITAHREIKKDPYAYKHGLECDFHKHIDAGALYCSQSIVRRWFYVLCDFCCDPLSIIKIPGVHTPKEKFAPLSKLNSSFSTVSLNDSKHSSCSSNINVTKMMSHMRLSKKSTQENICHQNETNSKPIQIIDHSKLTRKLPEVKERPLRPPYSKSALIDDDDDDNDDDDTLDNESIDYSERSFPSIGRGAVPKRKTQEKKSSAGHGYASALKS